MRLVGPEVPTLVDENRQFPHAHPLDIKMAGYYPRLWVDQDLSVSPEYSYVIARARPACPAYTRTGVNAGRAASRNLVE